MQNLLVLGQVPFTNLYISFWVWLGLVFVALPLAVIIYRRRYQLPAWLLAIYVSWLIRRHKLGYQV